MISNELRNFEVNINRLKVSILRLRTSTLPHLQRITEEDAKSNFREFAQLINKVAEAESCIKIFKKHISEFSVGMRSARFSGNVKAERMNNKQTHHGKIGGLNDSLNRMKSSLDDLLRKIRTFNRNADKIRNNLEEEFRLGLLTPLEHTDGKAAEYNYSQSGIDSLSSNEATITSTTKVQQAQKDSYKHLKNQVYSFEIFITLIYLLIKNNRNR